MKNKLQNTFTSNVPTSNEKETVEGTLSLTMFGTHTLHYHTQLQALHSAIVV